MHEEGKRSRSTRVGQRVKEHEADPCSQKFQAADTMKGIKVGHTAMAFVSSFPSLVISSHTMVQPTLRGLPGRAIQPIIPGDGDRGPAPLDKPDPANVQGDVYLSLPKVSTFWNNSALPAFS